jgi:hypothetical protein
MSVTVPSRESGIFGEPGCWSLAREGAPDDPFRCGVVWLGCTRALVRKTWGRGRSAAPAWTGEFRWLPAVQIPSVDSGVVMPCTVSRCPSGSYLLLADARARSGRRRLHDAPVGDSG